MSELKPDDIVLHTVNHWGRKSGRTKDKHSHEATVLSIKGKSAVVRFSKNGVEKRCLLSSLRKKE